MDRWWTGGGQVTERLVRTDPAASCRAPVELMMLLLCLSSSFMLQFHPRLAVKLTDEHEELHVGTVLDVLSRSPPPFPRRI